MEGVYNVKVDLDELRWRESSTTYYKVNQRTQCQHKHVPIDVYKSSQKPKKTNHTDCDWSQSVTLTLFVLVSLRLQAGLHKLTCDSMAIIITIMVIIPL